jgi:hypothetical protein
MKKMIEQTDFAVTAGIICSGAGAVLFKKMTGITAWISYPIGAILGFFVVSITIFMAISLIGKLTNNGK